MVDFTYPQLNSQQGTDTAETMRNYANAAANLVCDMYAAYPSGIIPSLGDPSGIGAFTQGIMDGLCNPRGKTPPPPQSPFTGGQCAALYNLRGTYTTVDGTEPFDAGNGYGKITNYRTVTGDTPTRNIAAFVDQGVGTADQRLNVRLYVGGEGSDRQLGTISFTPVRIDGLPDNCGSPPPVYPPTLPPANNYTTNAPVTINNSPVTIPVTIIPTVFAPVNIFRPEINVNVGGVNVNFDLGGVNFTINPPAGTTPVLPPNDTRPTKPPSTPPTSPTKPAAPTDLSEVYKQLADIKACACKKATVVSNSVFGNSRGLATPLPSRSQYVTLSISVGSSVRYQASEGNAPDVHYVGWLSFGIGGVYGERLPLSYSDNAFIVPEGADSVAFSLVFGSTGILRAYYLLDVVPS